MAVKRTDAFAEYAIIVMIMAMGVFLTGCAVVENVPTPGDVLSHPIGTESIKVGMSKAQVESIWGRPDDVRMVEDKAKWGGAREMWVYRAQYGSIPVDAGYFSKDKKLFFDGNNLTNIE